MFKVFSTFTGIGGFELGIMAGARQHDVDLVGYSEIDKYAVSVYERHFKGVKNYGDITKIEAETLPEFDCIVGGFPCQAFSIAGRRKGFDDTRGTLFFDLARILRAKRPRLFVFENVKGLLSHDGGKTFRVIIATIDELGYDCQWQVLNSKNFGVPQNRERILIVGHLRGTARPQVFPITENSHSDIVLPTLTARYFAAQSNGGYIRHKPEADRPTSTSVIVTGSPKYVDGKRTVEYKTSVDVPTIRATQYKSGDNQPKVIVTEATTKGYAEAGIGDSINLSQPNSKTRRGRVGKGIANTLDTGMQQHTLEPTGSVRRLTPIECERLQAFPDDWTKFAEGGGEISDTQRYKMCGNAVTTNVIKAVFERIFSTEGLI